MKPIVMVLIGVVLLGLVVVVGLGMLEKKQSIPVGCPMEAMLCPDGSAVGRSGPACAFAPCSSVPVSDERIRVTEPQANALVKSPLIVRGEARGSWYFEASFPVRLIDADGKELAVMPAQALGDWMTTDFVPYEVTLTFPAPTTPTGKLILERDNPSGLPENAASIEIPVRFAPGT